MKFGRIRPVAPGPHIRLSSYLRQTLPAPPLSCDYSAKAVMSLRNIYDNDTLGCCVIASRYHGVGTATGNAGDEFSATSAQIIKDYSAIGGYVPGNAATDQGCDEVTAQNYWLKNGYANGTKPLGYVSIDASNQVELQTAIWLFESADICIELPDAWVSPFPSSDGFIWGVAAANPNNGHCVQGYGYSLIGTLIDSWGLYGTITWTAMAALAVSKVYGSCYAVLTPDLLAKGAAKCPNGIAWADLINDFDAMGGHVPTPAPAPMPAPAGPVTLAGAQTWVKAALAGGSALMTRSQAESIAAAGLAAHWPTS